tara:strand:+ start:2263 stop:2475 length:213 start_codon:yes stop_codon:yes gene_type:complete
MLKNFFIKMNKILKINQIKSNSKKNISNNYIFDIDSKKITKDVEKELKRDNFDIYEYFLKNRNDRDKYIR